MWDKIGINKVLDGPIVIKYCLRDGSEAVNSFIMNSNYKRSTIELMMYTMDIAHVNYLIIL